MPPSAVPLFFFSLFCGALLASWNLPYISNQEETSQPDEKRSVIKSSLQRKRESRIASCEQIKCRYLPHQKNRLSYFADHDKYIWFTDKGNKYTFFLSNYYPAPIKMWNMKFLCSEAAFQAAKFLEKPEIIVRFTSLEGHDAFELAQSLSHQQRGDWYQVREKIMLEVLRAKFEQHPELTELLMATGDAYLVEHSDRDPFWTDGGDGKGKNRLGKLLMQLRLEKGGAAMPAQPEEYAKFIQH